MKHTPLLIPAVLLSLSPLSQAEPTPAFLKQQLPPLIDGDNIDNGDRDQEPIRPTFNVPLDDNGKPAAIEINPEASIHVLCLGQNRYQLLNQNGIPVPPTLNAQKLFHSLQALELEAPEETTIEILLHDDLHPLEATIAHNSIVRSHIGRTIVTQFGGAEEQEEVDAGEGQEEADAENTDTPKKTKD